MNHEATIEIQEVTGDWTEMDDSRITFTNGVDEIGRNVTQILADVQADATRPVRIVSFDTEAEVATDRVLASMTGDLLAKVAQASTRATAALQTRDTAIRTACANGATLREIAEAAHVAHQTVANIRDRG